MSPGNEALTQVSSIINQGTSCVICLPVSPSVDSIAAATSLYLGLIKLGKNVSIVCSTLQQSDLHGADKIQQNFQAAGDNLVISLPYTDGSIDRVDYNIQGENFNLIITPKQGFSKLDAGEVKYSYTGGTVDFVITIDSPALKNLGAVYQDNQKQFQGRKIINVDRHLTNTFYGTANIVQKKCNLNFGDSFQNVKVPKVRS